MNHFSRLSAVFVATASVTNADVIGNATLNLFGEYTGATSVDLLLNDDGTTTFVDGFMAGGSLPLNAFSFAETSDWEPLNWELTEDGIIVQFAMSYLGHATFGAIVNTIVVQDGFAQGDWFDHEYASPDGQFPEGMEMWYGAGSFSVVPAPGALALIGLAGFGRRRRGSC